MTCLAGDLPDLSPFIISFYTVVRYLLLSPCVVFFCCLILGRDYVMGVGRSLTIDLSLFPKQRSIGVLNLCKARDSATRLTGD